jgi:hypothetical protein
MMKTTINVFKLASCFPLTHIQLASHARTICTIPHCLHILPLFSLSLSLSKAVVSGRLLLSNTLSSMPLVVLCPLLVLVERKSGVEVVHGIEKHMFRKQANKSSCCDVLKCWHILFSSRNIFLWETKHTRLTSPIKRSKIL